MINFQYARAHDVVDAVRQIAGDPNAKFVAGGTNLTDDRYLTVGSVNYTAGETVGSYNPPRMWYVTVRAKMP